MLKSYILVDHLLLTKGDPVSSLSGISFFFFFSFSTTVPISHHSPPGPPSSAPLACWLTHHPAPPLPVIKRSVMATAVRGWKNVLRLPGTDEVRWTLSPSLKRALKGGGEGGRCYNNKYNLSSYTGITTWKITTQLDCSSKEGQFLYCHST